MEQEVPINPPKRYVISLSSTEAGRLRAMLAHCEQTADGPSLWSKLKDLDVKSIPVFTSIASTRFYQILDR